MGAVATKAPEALADIVSSACDSAETEDALIACFDAAERAVSVALGSKRRN